MSLPDTWDEFTKASVCQHKGCDEPARWTLQVKLWAKGFSKDSTPLTAQISAKVCDEHRWDPKDQFWTPEAKERIVGAMQAIGKAEPDFDSSEFEWVLLGTTL